jgi:CDP-glucose 4,6-dehydratase
LHEAHYLKLYRKKESIQLSWQPKWNINKALDEICSWHKAHINGEDMNEYSLNDIKMYSLQ